ncbi:GNAT family N-acetyltransferase [Brachybacterium alimentarium]|uniref:GNAT family N-acetyltransferase n=1 Tax=Brachybacterium alimentarium TaxID=47845 RepID=UPI003FD57A50
MTIPDLAAEYPPYGLRLHAGDLTLRTLAEDDLLEYAQLLRRPVFEDPESPQVFPWYKTEPEIRVREALRFQWRLRAAVSPHEWTLPLGIWADGRLIGCQDVAAERFAQRRTVTSGSWLTLEAHGKGYGKLMRQAMLVLAFDHLGATRAESSAVLGNAASFAVSHGCGYVENGTAVGPQPGDALIEQRFLVTPETFRRPTVPVQVEGVTPALKELLGA